MGQLLDDALKYASWGWRIFPVLAPLPDGSCPCRKDSCTSPGKHPSLKGWQKTATTNADTIQLWFQGKEDELNIGIATGKESGLLVLDQDGPAGLESLERLGIPITPSVSTGRENGGRHYYFKCPDDFDARNFAGRVDSIPGLDARANGGYVIAPPSRHASGRLYAWVTSPEEYDFADPPYWLIKELKAGKTTKEERKNKFGEGGRNEALFKMGRRLRRNGQEFEQVLASLALLNEQKCTPPLPNDEVRQIAESACREDYDSGPDLQTLLEDEDLGSIDLLDPVLVEMPLTELGNAEVFARLFQGKFYWVSKWKMWMRWTGQRWEEDVHGAVTRAMMRTIRARRFASSMVADDLQREQLESWALSQERFVGFDNALKIAKNLGVLNARPEQFDQHPLLFATPSGVWNFKTGRIEDPEPSYMLTKMTSVPYDPDAQCPLWEQTIREIFLDNEQVIEYFHRFIGYSLTGLTREQIMLICYGEGRNGKSTVLSTLQEILGDYSGMARWETFNADEKNSVGDDLASLRGFRQVLVIEAEYGQKLSESRVKSITGGEPITCRFLYGKDFTYKPEFKVIMAVNDKPVIRGQGEGIWRRIHLLPFLAQFDEAHGNRDKNRAQALLEEAPGILKWGLEGAKKYFENGLVPPSDVQEATQEYRDDSDILGHWIEDNTVQDSSKMTAMSELYANYKQWSLENGYRPISAISLGKSLTRHGFTKGKNKRGMTAYKGLGLVDNVSWSMTGDGEWSLG